MNASLRLHTAALLDPGSGDAIPDGAVVVAGNTVLAVGPTAEVRTRFPQATLGHAGRVIAPPPVNAHTHLDLSLIPFRALAYDRWVLEHVGANLHLSGKEGAERGLQAVQSSGAAAFGDITELPEVMTFLLEAEGASGVAYWQVFDPNPHTADDTFRRTVEHVRAWRRLERPGGVRVGLSPHATYTVSHRLHRLLAAFARDEGLPMQIHAAEHGSEFEMFRSGSGPLAEKFWRVMAPLTPHDVWGRAPDPELTPVRYLSDLGVLDVRPTLIHMVHVTEDDALTVAQAGCAVVTCPRSNAALECGAFDWERFGRYGVSVAVGTDSVASGETLDVHDDLAFVRRTQPDLAEATLVRAAVRGGARVVGCEVPTLSEGGTWDDAFLWRS